MKKGTIAWDMIIYGLIGVGILVVVWYIAGGSLGTSSKTIDGLQSCIGQKGQCSPVPCKPEETSSYKGFGCGSDKMKGKDYCCIPPSK